MINEIERSASECSMLNVPDEVKPLLLSGRKILAADQCISDHMHYYFEKRNPLYKYFFGETLLKNAVAIYSSLFDDFSITLNELISSNSQADFYWINDFTAASDVLKNTIVQVDQLKNHQSKIALLREASAQLRYVSINMRSVFEWVKNQSGPVVVTPPLFTVSEEQKHAYVEKKQSARRLVGSRLSSCESILTTFRQENKLTNTDKDSLKKDLFELLKSTRSTVRECDNNLIKNWEIPYYNISTHLVTITNKIMQSITNAANSELDSFGNRWADVAFLEWLCLKEWVSLALPTIDAFMTTHSFFEQLKEMIIQGDLLQKQIDSNDQGVDFVNRDFQQFLNLQNALLFMIDQWKQPVESYINPMEAMCSRNSCQQQDAWEKAKMEWATIKTSVAASLFLNSSQPKRRQLLDSFKERYIQVITSDCEQGLGFNLRAYPIQLDCSTIFEILASSLQKPRPLLPGPFNLRDRMLNAHILAHQRFQFKLDKQKYKTMIAKPPVNHSA